MQKLKLIVFILIFSFVALGCSSQATKENSPPSFDTNNVILKPQIDEKQQKPILYKIPLLSQLQTFIWQQSQKYNLSYELILAVIYVESRFQSDAVSYNNTSLGIMQLNKNTYPWLAQKIGIKDFDVYNPRHNIVAGIWYLNYLRDYCYKKDLTDEQAFAAMLIFYHRGINGGIKYIKKYGFNSKYVQAVYNYKTKLEKGEFNVYN